MYEQVIITQGAYNFFSCYVAASEMTPNKIGHLVSRVIYGDNIQDSKIMENSYSHDRNAKEILL